ncbi:thioredoxin family protein [Nocardia iowensis]|uniref:thioredoxin family protein n=1 Tax=Nocardia iowensis TaxID=204891 RepID=UPI0033D20462
MPVLAHFRADWSSESRQVDPSLEAIYSEHRDQIEIVNLDIDRNPTTAAPSRARRSVDQQLRDRYPGTASSAQSTVLVWMLYVPPVGLEPTLDGF